MVGVNVNPIEILIGEFSGGGGREAPMYRHFAGPNFILKTLLHATVNSVHNRLALSNLAAKPALGVCLIGNEFPGIHQVQLPGFDDIENRGRELALIDADFRANGILRHASQQSLPLLGNGLPLNEYALHSSKHFVGSPANFKVRTRK